jgi:hypothetical protein
MGLATLAVGLIVHHDNLQDLRFAPRILAVDDRKTRLMPDLLSISWLLLQESREQALRESHDLHVVRRRADEVILRGIPLHVMSASEYVISIQLWGVYVYAKRTNEFAK